MNLTSGTAAPPALPSAPSGGFLRQLIKLIAIVLTFCLVAFGVVWFLTSGGITRTASDTKLVELLVKADFADRAFFTEQELIRTNHTELEEEQLDPGNQAVKELAAAANSFGIANLKLTDSAADKQIMALLTDPAKRLAESREEIWRGHPAGDESVATYTNMQMAIRDLTAKAPDLIQTAVLVPSAKQYATAVATGGNPWPLTVQTPDNDFRQGALDTLVETTQNSADKAHTAPTIFMWVTIGLAVLAAAAWALLLMGRKTWAKPVPKAPKAAREPKAPKAARQPKAPKVPGLAKTAKQPLEAEAAAPKAPIFAKKTMEPTKAEAAPGPKVDQTQAAPGPMVEQAKAPKSSIFAKKTKEPTEPKAAPEPKVEQAKAPKASIFAKKTKEPTEPKAAPGPKVEQAKAPEPKPAAATQTRPPAPALGAKAAQAKAEPKAAVKPPLASSAPKPPAPASAGDTTKPAAKGPSFGHSPATRPAPRFGQTSATAGPAAPKAGATAAKPAGATPPPARPPLGAPKPGKTPPEGDQTPKKDPSTDTKAKPEAGRRIPWRTTGGGS
ncbi:MAG: hypothetical protein FWD29_02850 [Micrococcales bacterium]|nr:hypothetical protein [Micrococcales bacterium]